MSAELNSSHFTLPVPFPWQAAFLQQEAKLQPKLSVLCCGRRSGKTFVALLWALLAKGGLLEGGHVCWIAPDDKRLAEARSWAKAWLGPLIVPGNPGSIGLDLSNGGRLDFWGAGPQAPQPARGRGYSLAVIDEAAFVVGLRLMVDASIRPALALAGGRMLMISTPRGRNDFHDYYREAEREGLAFYAPSTVNPELKPAELEKIRRTTAPIVYEQEYEARFVEMAGALLKRDQIRYGPAPMRESLVSVGFGIDLALATHDRSDYSSLVVTGIDAGKNLWVLMARRWRKTWPETVVLLAEYNRLWQPQIAICEQVAFQELAVRDLEKVGLPLVPLKVSKGKEERFLPVLTKYALGLVWHADTLDPEFEAELLSFPESAHDDWVDALVYGVAGLQREIRDAWTKDLGSGAHWGRSVLPHEKPRTLYYVTDHMGTKPVYLDELVGEPETDPNEVMTIERGIEKNIEELCKHFFPMGRESGLGYEIRLGLNVRVNEPIVFFDTQCGGGSGDFLRLLVHMQAAANLDQARAQVEKWLGEKGVKLEATR